MPEEINITDSDLLTRLKNSFIADGQKNELETLIPEMTNDERGQLIALIEQSNEEAVKDDPEYQQELQKLNAEYDEKLNTLVKEKSKEALQEAESMEDEEEAKELDVMEGEIANISEESRTQVSEKLQPNLKQSHVIRNLILIILALVVVAGTVLLIINSL